jgi:large subunit ribosomal protein L14e
MIFDIGRVCIKLAGRDAGKPCIVVNIIDDSYVLIEGETRRRKCNVAHLEPLPLQADVSENASREDVVSALSNEGFSVSDKKSSRSVEPKTLSKRTQLSIKKNK